MCECMYVTFTYVVFSCYLTLYISTNAHYQNNIDMLTINRLLQFVRRELFTTMKEIKLLATGINVQTVQNKEIA